MQYVMQTGMITFPPFFLLQYLKAHSKVVDTGWEKMNSVILLKKTNKKKH